MSIQRESTRIIYESRKLRNIDMESSIQRENSKKRKLNKTSGSHGPHKSQRPLELKNTNGQKINFYRNSLEIDESDDSYIPEPQSLEENFHGNSIHPQQRRQELDQMFNMMLSEKQQDKTNFAQEYLQRKIDNRIHEIEQLSNEKKRRDYIEDAQIVLKNRIKDEYAHEPGLKTMLFHKIPDPAYLRGKAEVMTNAEVLKQRMKPNNINKKADEIVRNYLHSSGKKKGKKKRKRNASDEQRDSEEQVLPEFSNTLDMRIGSDLTTEEDMLQRASTFGSNTISEPKNEFQDTKGRVIMQGQNRIAQLENIVCELQMQVDYLNANECSQDLVEKVTQYHKLIERQIVNTLNLSSFKYLQKSINSVIDSERTRTRGAQSQSSIDSMKINGNNNFLSPQPTKFLESCLSQPTYRLSNQVNAKKKLFSPFSEEVDFKVTNEFDHETRAEPPMEIKSRRSLIPLPGAGAKIKPQSYRKPTENLVNRTHFKKSKGNKPSQESRKLYKQKKEKNGDIHKKLVDMKNTTAGVLNKRNRVKKRIRDHMMKHKKNSVATDYASEINKKLGQAIDMAIHTENNFKEPNSQIGSLKNFQRRDKPQNIIHPSEESKGMASNYISVHSNYQDQDYTVKGPFFSNYTKNAYFMSPHQDENTETNVEADLHYDSDRCEISFSNEKIEKSRSRSKVPLVLTSKVLKY
ncbi:unnamed protein product [Moneuplotes crassus]|uniref:Uncharacterized protein n=1 Tax=Euplotes crassus TaxID=5936 RepID=A0AAD1U298_EUPCR|nr:unnamed protein product [Moneuplotes crassus]